MAVVAVSCLVTGVAMPVLPVYADALDTDRRPARSDDEDTLSLRSYR
jgi:hypothetical protein